MAFNINFFVENYRLFKVTVSHVHCESGSIAEMVQDTHVFTTYHYILS